jgi:hypothetical protein
VLILWGTALLAALAACVANGMGGL